MISSTEWRKVELIGGAGLVLGRGFDYDGLIEVMGENLEIRAPYPSREGDECYPYPQLLELVVPIEMVKTLLEKRETE